MNCTAARRRIPRGSDSMHSRGIGDSRPARAGSRYRQTGPGPRSAVRPAARALTARCRAPSSRSERFRSEPHRLPPLAFVVCDPGADSPSSPRLNGKGGEIGEGCDEVESFAGMVEGGYDRRHRVCPARAARTLPGGRGRIGARRFACSLTRSGRNLLIADTPAIRRKAQIDALLLELPGVESRTINGLDAYFISGKMFACVRSSNRDSPARRGGDGTPISLEGRRRFLRARRRGEAEGMDADRAVPMGPTTRRIFRSSSSRSSSSGRAG